MITKAKVSLGAVKAFKDAVVDCRDFSNKFKKGISCVEQLLIELAESENELKEKQDEMQLAQKQLDVKICNIEQIIVRFTVRVNELHERLLNLEHKYSYMKPTYTTMDVNGELHEFPNPSYVALSLEISQVQGEISVAESELYTYEQRLEKIRFVYSQLSVQIDAFNNTVYVINEKKGICKNIISELENIKTYNLKKSALAYEKLQEIEDIIKEYKNIMMKYSEVDYLESSSDTRGLSTVNINVNNTMTAKEQQSQFSQTYIKKHGIKFDENNHICEFEGRKYGGKFNSYEECIKRTPKNNPVRGKWEGDRGESKFIASNRSAKGIVVINILKQYGLDGIEYRNAEPDFEVCSEAVIKIKGMTESIENYPDEYGLQQLGNFWKADIELARQWNLDLRDGRSDWTARDIKKYREVNGLTWHEKCDGETVVLVKREINNFFNHLGGRSECGKRDKGEFDEE